MTPKTDPICGGPLIPPACWPRSDQLGENLNFLAVTPAERDSFRGDHQSIVPIFRADAFVEKVPYRCQRGTRSNTLPCPSADAGSRVKTSKKNVMDGVRQSILITQAAGTYEFV